MYNLFAEHPQINQIIQNWFTSNLCYKPILTCLLVEDWIQSLDSRDSLENLKCKLVITVYIVAGFYFTGHKV